MALLEISVQSEALDERTRLNILFPEQKGRKLVPSDLPVVYLLHGYSGNESDWLLETNISMLSDVHNVAVVMPYGGRSFYANLPIGSHFETYITEEIPALLRDWFGLDAGRERTVIAGNSMGAFGAVRLGLNHPDKYRAVGAFSGPLDVSMFEIAKAKDEASYRAGMLAFGNPESIAGSEHDPLTWLDRYVEKRKKGDCPRVDIATYCGTDDSLVDFSRAFVNNARARGLEMPLFLSPGGHNFLYWQRILEQWLSRVMNEQARLSWN